MKKLLFLIPLMIVFISACGDVNTTESKKFTEDNSTSQPINPDDNNDNQTNPDGNGEGSGTTDPEPGGDGEGGTTTDPEPSGDGEGGTTTDPENPADKPGYDITFNAKTDVFQPQYYYGRSFLNETEQKVYDHILKNLLEFNVTDENKDKYLICVPLYSDGVKLEFTSDVLKVLAKITGYIAYDEQRITYLYSVAPKGPTGTSLKYTFDSIDRKYYTNEVCFNVRNVTDMSGLYGAKLADTKAKYDEEMQKVEEGVIAILSKLKEDMTDAQKFRILHDEFLKRVSYGQKDEGTGDIRGGFIYNKVFCEGYARTLAYLCQRAGLECLYVVGTASYSGNGDGGSNAPFDHAWIKVKLDDKWYNVDPTNNDSLDPTSEGIVYNDFLLSDSEFNDDHEAGITAGVTGSRQPTSYPSFPEANESMNFSLTEYNK